MAKSFIKANYTRRIRFGFSAPFYHTFLEVHYKGKITKVGYFSLTDFLWCLSLLIPVIGELRQDNHKADYSVVLSTDKKKIKKVLKLIKSQKYDWEVYHALFRNCFDWRNTVLKVAGIKYPTEDWFWRK